MDEAFLMELKTSGLTLVLYIPETCFIVDISLNNIRTPELLLGESNMKVPEAIF